jgi:tetrahydromethanopterin S-methyltransferase subunit F
MPTLTERVACLETNEKTIFHQLDEIRADVNDIHELSASVKVIATETVNISQKVDKIDNRLSEVEKQPVAAYTHYKRLIAGCVITGVLGAIIAALMAVILK